MREEVEILELALMLGEAVLANGIEDLPVEVAAILYESSRELCQAVPQRKHIRATVTAAYTWPAKDVQRADATYAKPVLANGP